MQRYVKKVSFDVEGVTKFGDNAKRIADEVFSPEAKEKYKGLIFDVQDNEDDETWRREKYVGHCTGRTPPVVQIACGVLGIDDEKLVDFTRKTSMDIPGKKRLFEYLKNQGIEIYLISNAYPSVPLLDAYENDISSFHVFSSGYQIQHMSDYDKKRIKEIEKMRAENKWAALLEETKLRSPMKVLAKDGNRAELERFLDAYLEVTGKIFAGYSSGMGDMQELKLQRRNLVKSVSNGKLRKTLDYMLNKEHAIMGAENKWRAVQSVVSDDELTAFTGDSIVDVNPIGKSDRGIAFNCTNKEALLIAKLNICTINWANAIPVYEHVIFDEIFDPQQIKKEADSELIRVFTPDDIINNFDEVKTVNKAFKTELAKALQ